MVPAGSKLTWSCSLVSDLLILNVLHLRLSFALSTKLQGVFISYAATVCTPETPCYASIASQE